MTESVFQPRFSLSADNGPDCIATNLAAKKKAQEAQKAHVRHALLVVSSSSLLVFFSNSKPESSAGEAVFSDLRAEEIQ